jgi:hypothetical protein
MRTEISSIEQKNKLPKINKKTKTIQTKPFHSNALKQKGAFTSNINKYNYSLSNTKKDENNSSILNSQKKCAIQGNKFSIQKIRNFQ